MKNIFLALILVLPAVGCGHRPWYDGGSTAQDGWQHVAPNTWEPEQAATVRVDPDASAPRAGTTGTQPTGREYVTPHQKGPWRGDAYSPDGEVPSLELTSALGLVIPTNDMLGPGIMLDLSLETRVLPYVEAMVRLQVSLTGIGEDFVNARYHGELFGLKTMVGLRGLLPVTETVSLYAGAFVGWRVNDGDIHFESATIELTRDALISMGDGYNLMGTLGVKARMAAGMTFGVEISAEFHEADLLITERDSSTGLIIPGDGIVANDMDLGEVVLRLYGGVRF